MTNILESASATNVVTAVSEIAEASNDPAPTDGDFWGEYGGIFVGAATVVLAVAAIRWLHRWIAKAGDEVSQSSCASDIVDALAVEESKKDALRNELEKAILGEGTLQSDPLASILRIEESYEKWPRGKYLRRISVLRRKDGTNGSLMKIESEIGWEYIPDAVRGKFIETRENKVVRLVYDAKGENKA